MPDMDFGQLWRKWADAVETCIAAAPNVLWLADGDTGHGNALAVAKKSSAHMPAVGAAAGIDRRQDLAAAAWPMAVPSW